MKEEFLWVEKYRPHKISECVLPKDMKKLFQSFIDSGEIQNLLLYGTPGSGKTTVAKALCNELDVDYLFINASNENSIDILRNKITNFVTTGSLLSTGRKFVILDESDNLSPAFMSALRSFVERFSANAGFIFTANYQNKIIDPLRSRLLNIEFNLNDDSMFLMSQYMKVLENILDQESIKYDRKILARLIQKFFPDFRRTLNEIQRYSVGGIIDSGIFTSIKEIDINEVMNFMKMGEWGKMRTYFDLRADSIDSGGFVEDIYNSLDKYFEPASIPEIILHIGDYNAKSYMAVSKKIALIDLCTRIMIDGVFK